MSKGKDSAEEEKVEKEAWTMRRCLVLQRIYTNTDHNPGAVILYDGPDETGIIRSLTEQELEDFADHKSKIEEEKLAPPEAGSSDAFKESARRDIINEAIGRLDHSEDSSWTESGQPAVNAVSRALMNMQATVTDTSRAEIRKFAPTFRRKVEEELAEGI